MSDDQRSGSGLSRRNYLRTSGAALAAATSLAGCSGGSAGGGDGGDGGSTGSSGSDEDPITVGVVDAQSGNAALTGTPKVLASELAVSEINDEGGIMGREVELLTPDPESDINTFQQHVRRLINEDEADAIWCGIRSSVREAVRPIMDRNEQLYFYTTQYEGGVCDKYTFPMGATARQQLRPVMEHMTNEFGSDIYTIAADYNFGQLSADWVEILAEDMGATVIGEEFVPLSQSQFSSSINNIQEADPDFVMSILVGANHASFYEERAAAGLDVPMGTSTVMALPFEHIRLDPPALQNVHVGANYMQEFDTERNNDFVDRYYEMHPDARYLNQSAHNNYFSMHLYKNAVEEAGTTNQDEVIATLEEGMEVEAPEGDITLNGPTHHMSHHMRIARADENHNIEVLNGQEGDLIEPSFLQDVGCDLTEEVETTQYTPADL
ncbi:urea ABC transporter substrate-binding protein [Halomicroarcula sp. GCM10025324]|uniref:urea ABC transporter substrate-binding protein n=1 Tax=Haloarcula TaxID=2237 RepID=UPI0023E7B8A4|nr:urea ABC transporter substrate-binding protein [Halomicroarcula sp. ZS-22-S1]